MPEYKKQQVWPPPIQGQVFPVGAAADDFDTRRRLTDDPTRFPKLVLKALGLMVILCAAFGLWYTVSSLGGSFSGPIASARTRYYLPYFDPIFHVMSAICIACYSFLMILGIQIFCVRLRYLGFFTALLAFEVIYAIAVSFADSIVHIGDSIAAANGVANGGMSVQLIILFPLWAPVVAYWAKRRLHDPRNVA